MLKIAIVAIILVFLISFLNSFFRSLIFDTKNQQKESSRSIGADLDNRKEINYDNLLIRINELRLNESLPQFKVNFGLQNFAVARAEEINNTSTFTHLSKLKIENYSKSFSLTGELIASNYLTTGDVINGWLKSPTHRDILLSKEFDSIGIGIVKDNPKLEDIIVVELGKHY